MIKGQNSRCRAGFGEYAYRTISTKDWPEEKKEDFLASFEGILKIYDLGRCLVCAGYFLPKSPPKQQVTIGENGITMGKDRRVYQDNAPTCIGCELYKGSLVELITPKVVSQDNLEQAASE